MQLAEYTNVTYKSPANWKESTDAQFEAAVWIHEMFKQ